ncbi:hypothetical protein [Rhizobium sp. BK176]|uniref:hypothetical protein n=1 Tax=Rhizobium sp. BK176 TaxID=2587071 RepID=UPI0021687627|nr:hypothetical protein [Rhizobium sp. BK176]MCS4088458.1 hypothetical protein [Rhizobium sp. BK176]
MECSLVTQKALVEVYGRIPPLPIARTDWRKVKLAVAGQVFGRTFNDDEALDDFIEDQEHYDKSNQINRYLVEATGIGPNLFTVTSMSYPEMDFGVDTTMLDFDKAHYRQIEEDIAKEERREPRPYRESLYKVWTRTRIDGELVYGFVSAAGPCLWDVLEAVLFDWIDANMEPYLKSGGTQEALAADIERQMESPEPHEKLRDDTYAAGSRLINTMLTDEGFDRIFTDDDPWVSRKVENDGHETREEIVFSNARAMEMARFGSFHADIAALPDGTASFDSRVASVVEEFRSRLKELADAIKVSGDG